MDDMERFSTAESSVGSSSGVSSAATSETVVQPSAPDRPLFTTAFTDYTVSEGLLLMILLALVIGAVIRFFRG